jgi:tetratricopeptide (TPR) repeat protein
MACVTISRETLFKLAGLATTAAVVGAVHQTGLEAKNIAGLLLDVAHAAFGHIGLEFVHDLANHFEGKSKSRDMHRLIGEAIARVMESSSERVPTGLSARWIKDAAESFRGEPWLNVELTGAEIVVTESKLAVYFSSGRGDIDSSEFLTLDEWIDLIENVVPSVTFEPKRGLAIGHARQALQYCAKELNEHFKSELMESAKHAWKKNDLAWPELLLQLLSTIIASESANTAHLHELRREIKALIETRDVGKEANPHDLPRRGLHGVPPAPHIIGRSEIIAGLLDAARRESPRVFGITGPPGVGKSALILKLCELLEDDYPTAQFYFDLKGDTTEPLTSMEIMVDVVRELNMTKQQALSEEVQQSLYIDELHDKRVLLLMDNARSVQQIQQLIPKGKCFLFVASRWKLDDLAHWELEDRAQKEIPLLDRADSVELLKRVASRLRREELDELDDLARLCGDLPLALRAVGCTLQKHVNLSLAEYRRRLHETEQRAVLDEIDPYLQRSTAAALQSSYELLGDQLQRCFRLLGVFPDIFDLAAAQAMWNNSREFARDSLDELVSYGLIEFGEDSSRLHDLVRVFARARMTPSEEDTVFRGHAQYYFGELVKAQQLYQEGGESRAKALKLLNGQKINFQAGQKWSAKQIHDNEAAKLCWRYAHDAPNCLQLLSDRGDQVRWLEDALRAARGLGDIEWEVWALRSLGWTLKGTGDYERAIECHAKCLDMAVASERRDWEIEALFGKALAHMGRPGEDDMAEELLHRRLKIPGNDQDGAALGALGEIYYRKENYELARDYSLRRLEIERQGGRPAGHALEVLGRAYHKLEDIDAAKSCHEECLRISREIDDIVCEHTALGNLGDLYFTEADYSRAYDYHTRRAEIARKIADKLGEALGLFGSARALHRLAKSVQEFGDAMRRGEEALGILESIKSGEASRVRDELQKWRLIDPINGIS